MIVRSIGTALVAVGFCLLAGSLPALAQPAMWVVKDADSTIYLFGTVSMLKPQTDWQTPKLKEAMSASSELWLELPTTDPAVSAGETLQLVAKYGLSRGAKLSERITPDEMKAVNTAAPAGLSMAQLNLFRPWFVALTIAGAYVQSAGYSPNFSADSAIEATFKARGIKPKGLETVDQQLRVYGDLQAETELAYLRTVLASYDQTAARLDTMVEYWLRGDLSGLEQSILNDPPLAVPAIREALFARRNLAWADRLEQMLAGEGVVFFAVAAGHFVGPDSVVAMLAAKGVKAERVQ